MEDQAERMAVLLESALSDPSIYQMFSMLRELSLLPIAEKLCYMDEIKEKRVYSEKQLKAISHLILGEDGSGRGAKAIMLEIETIREEKVSREIDDLVKYISIG